MNTGALKPTMTWAEDRATQRCDPSADPGANTEGRPDHRFNPWTAKPSSLRDWHQSDKPSPHDAATGPQDATFQLANTKCSEFQLTVNQDTRQWR